MSRRGTSDTANIGLIENVDMSKGFSSDVPVNVKINGTEPVKLTVHMYDEAPGIYVETTFFPGWNPEIIDEIQANAAVSNVQIGM